MTLGQEFYKSLDDTLAATIAGPVGFGEYVQSAPVGLPYGVHSERENRLNLIHSFFKGTARVFRDVVDGQAPPGITSLLLNDVQDDYRVSFHRSLPDEAWTLPSFFRTDESANGEIFEIQCPGSGWGDLQLLTNAYRRYHAPRALGRYEPSRIVAEEIVHLCGNEHPAVLHLLDNSSYPASMRYLIATTQPPLHYWGYDRSVKVGECALVRSHSFFGLVAENLFRERLRNLVNGRVQFDLPPIIVFDQKTPLCLPFIKETAGYFSSAIREMLVYSYPVLENGFRDVNGDWVNVETFAERPASARRYFLKYAGCDVCLNWGSRGVYRLSDSKGKAKARLQKAAADARRGRFWLIQPEKATKETISYFDRVDGSQIDGELTARYSCFYGPRRLIGIRTMHRRHYKVHGQGDTVVGLAVPR